MRNEIFAARHRWTFYSYKSSVHQSGYFVLACQNEMKSRNEMKPNLRIHVAF